MRGARVPSAGLWGRKGCTRDSPKSPILFLVRAQRTATVPVPDMWWTGMVWLPIHRAATSLTLKEIRKKKKENLNFKHLLLVLPREKARGIRNDSAVMPNAQAGWTFTSTATLRKSCGSQGGQQHWFFAGVRKGSRLQALTCLSSKTRVEKGPHPARLQISDQLELEVKGCWERGGTPPSALLAQDL